MLITEQDITSAALDIEKRLFDVRADLGKGDPQEWVNPADVRDAFINRGLEAVLYSREALINAMTYRVNHRLAILRFGGMKA